MNKIFFSDEINHTINLSKPIIIFVSSTNLEKISAAAMKHKCVKQIILFDYGVSDVKTSNLKSNPLSFASIIESEDDAHLNDFTCQPQNVRDNVALIMCSSGTTGLPKGVQLTQFNILFSNAQIK